MEALAKFAARTRRCAAIVGFVDQDRDLYNAAAVCAGGEIVGKYHKRLLPNNTVFDEQRYFTAGHDSDPLELYLIGGVKVGVSICEDIWSPAGPVAEQAAAGAELNININGSPVRRREGRAAGADAGDARRRRPLRDRLRESGRRAGRVGLRRGFAGLRPRGHAARPRTAVRRIAHDRRRAGPAGLPEAAARPARPGDAGDAAGRRGVELTGRAVRAAGRADRRAVRCRPRVVRRARARDP